MSQSPPDDDSDAKSVADHASDIVEMFDDDADINQTEVEEELTELINQYQVPVDEARSSVINNRTEDNGENISANGNETVHVNEINEDEQWVDLRVTVDQLWDPRSDSIAQVGLLGDESGTIKFVSFETSDLEEIEEGVSYELSNVVTDEYEGDYSVKLNKTTEITELDEDIEVGDNKHAVSGALVDMQSGSGLIERCPEEDCTRTLGSTGRCGEHGDVDGEDDLRIKGVLDDGSQTRDLIFNREMTEDITDISLDDAIEMAEDALDRDVVEEEMRDIILGQFYEVETLPLGDYELVESYTQLGTPSASDVEESIIKARSI